MLTIALASIIQSTTTAPYTVVEANRTTAFAGKLGNRVQDALVVERDGKRFHVTIGRQHTRFGKIQDPFQTGDHVTIHGVAVAGTLLVMPGDVRKV